MADASAQHPAPSPATVADIMHPPVTTVNQNDHVAAAAYLMNRAVETALIVTQGQTGEPIGIITDADISHAVADGKNPSDVRIYQLMTTRPTVISTTASIRDAAKVMTSGHFRHLPVMGDAGLVGIVDITDVLRARCSTYPRPGRRSRHLIRRSMEHVRSVRRNPYPLVSVLPGVRNRRHGPAPSGQSVRKL
jgi:CBS domain-containing protein